MAKKRIIILGAGLAGLSAAWHLKKKGIEALVFEKEPEVGGLCRSKKINGFTFDYDGHLLHFRHRYTLNLLKKILGYNLIQHKRSAWIYSHHSYIRYPFQANLHRLPSSIAQECLLEYIHRDGHFKEKHKLNFAEWTNDTFGKGIARHFMFPYNAKFWTVSPEELNCDWVDGFIPVPSIDQIIEGTIRESKRQFGYNAQFWYPQKGGINQIALILAERLKNIRTNSEITHINFAKKEIDISGGNREKYDYLISTIPLPEIFRLAESLPKEIIPEFKKLRWNSIFNFNIGIDRKDESGMHWIYFPQNDVCFFRVGFFQNFSSHLVPKGKSALYVEVAYSQHRPIDKVKIVLRIKGDLKKVRLLTSKDRIYSSDINDIKYGYPIYDKNYSVARRAILEFLSRNDVVPCGRYGSWSYMSMEDAILDGKKASELAREL